MNSRIVIAATCLAGCGRAAAARPDTPPPPVCPALPAPMPISIPEPKYDERHELFELPDTPALWAPAPEDEVAAAYRRALAQRIGDLAPRTLLTRNRAVFAAWSETKREVVNIDAVLGGVGAIGTPSCLERRLFARQAARYPLVEHPTEFGAFIVRGNGRVRVYFSGSDLVGQKIRPQVTDRVAADIASGLHLTAHLHSHPFCLDRKPGDRMWTKPETVNDVCGGLAPSLADANLWMGTEALEAGWITNGLDSIHVEKSAFPKFEKYD